MSTVSTCRHHVILNDCANPECRKIGDLRDVLIRHGFRECDNPACNCGSWHHVGGYAERFREIKDAFLDDGINLNGKVLLTAVKEVLTAAHLRESELNQLNDQTIEQRKVIDNLAMMCRRLSYQVRRDGNNDKLAHQCVTLLKIYDLGGSVIREMNAAEGSTSREGGQNPVVTPTKPPAHKYPETFCSQCGGEFGPGNEGFSHCENHKHLPRLG